MLRSSTSLHRVGLAEYPGYQLPGALRSPYLHTAPQGAQLRAGIHRGRHGDETLMQLFRRDVGLGFKPLLYCQPSMLERIFPAAPGVRDARLSVMRWPYLAVLPRCPKARKEIRERNATRCFCLRRRRAGFAAVRDVLLRFALPAQEVQWVERAKLRTLSAFGCLWHRRRTQGYQVT